MTAPPVMVLMPARNEAGNLPHVVEELREHLPDFEILVVDDASDDATPAVLRGLGVRSLHLSEHLGIGGAVRAGLHYADHLGYSIVVRIDADGQHRAADIPTLLAPILDDTADAVSTSRYQRGRNGGYRSSWSARLSQRFAAACLSLLTRRRITDPTSGMWAFGPRAVKLLVEHHPTGYPEPELQLLLGVSDLRVAEIAVQMRPRISGASKLKRTRAIMTVARVLLAFIVVPFRKPRGYIP